MTPLKGSLRMDRPLVIGASIALTVVLLAHPALGQTFSSGSTGAGGVFSPTCSPTPCTLTVTLPPSGVFNFTSVNIPVGITVAFTRNASNTPVTILAGGNILIAGTLDVSGAPGHDGIAALTSAVPTAGVGGAGGFNGGNGSIGIAAAGPSGDAGGMGLGPGGGIAGGCGGSFGTLGACGGTATYGTPPLLPLIGGSGGGGVNLGFGGTAPGGGGGGGAILVASSGTLTLTGSIVSRGGAGGNGVSGAGGGSGGAVRLVATTITGNGRVDVTGGGGVNGGRGGGLGRIRVESFANSAALVLVGGVVPSLGPPGPITLGDNAPTLTITSVAGLPAPAAPTGSYATLDVTLPATTSPIAIGLSASNVPPGTMVTVFVVGSNGGSSSATTTLAGTFAVSTASATLAIRTVESSVVLATTGFTLTATPQ
jgi:hypothetical protein